MSSVAEPWILIPVKSFSCGKQRLKNILNENERRKLNIFLFDSTIEVISEYPGVARISVVSDATDVLDYARTRGVDAIATMNTDLNGALWDGRRSLRSRNISRIIIIPIDLPDIEPGDVEQMADAGRDRRMVICPDRLLEGTNALLIDEHYRANFHFGYNSFNTHRDLGEYLGLQPYVLHNKNISNDIDLPTDSRVPRLLEKYRMKYDTMIKER